MAQQTAVEWLVEELKKVHHPTEAMLMYAKAMEKKQIEKAYYTGQESKYIGGEYYNETYKTL